MSKENRKRALEEEIEKLQKKLVNLESDEEFENEEENKQYDRRHIIIPKPDVQPNPSIESREPMPKVPDKDFMKDFDPFENKKVNYPEDKRHLRGRAFRFKGKISDEERKQLEEEKENIRQNMDEIRRQTRERFEEYRRTQRELREQEEGLREKEREMRRKHFMDDHWDHELEDEIEGTKDDLEAQLGEYTRSILSSVAESLKSSMGIAVRGAEDIGSEFKVVGKELGKLGQEIGKQISKEMEVKIGPTIPDEKLEEFYIIGAKLVGAIGDPNRLKILKNLEKGPKYQKELSDETDLRGGTFKHHMDQLMDNDVKFVTQEVVRGRYLLTARGREALKLTELQYSRYLSDKNIQASHEDDETSNSKNKEFNVKIR